jgi:hypothetical protein
MVKGQPLDYGEPVFFGNDIGKAFLQQILRTSGQEIARKFDIFVSGGGSKGTSMFSRPDNALTDAEGIANNLLERKNDLKKSIRSLLQTSLRM